MCIWNGSGSTLKLIAYAKGSGLSNYLLIVTSTGGVDCGSNLYVGMGVVEMF